MDVNLLNQLFEVFPASHLDDMLKPRKIFKTPAHREMSQFSCAGNESGRQRVYHTVFIASQRILVLK